jgi:hypothetical protein
MGKKFSDLAAATMSPESIARAKKMADEMRQEMMVDNVRRARRYTHESMVLGEHAGVADVEMTVDRYLASLRAHVEAMGGVLEVIALFPNGEVKIANFSDLGEDAVTRENGRLKASAP